VLGRRRFDPAALFVAPQRGAYVFEAVVGLYARASGLPLLALAPRVRA
jgi:hypothetical protein